MTQRVSTVPPGTPATSAGLTTTPLTLGPGDQAPEVAVRALVSGRAGGRQQHGLDAAHVGVHVRLLELEVEVGAEAQASTREVFRRLPRLDW